MIVRSAIPVLLVLCSVSLSLADQAMHFDLPATTTAVGVTPPELQTGERLVTVRFDLSLIVDSLPAPQVDQLLVQIKPLGGEALVADYAPRTELTSRYASDIEVSRSKEQLDNLGFSIDGICSPVVRGTISGERGEKNLESTKYSRVAPMHILAASGTTHRGRGVYFKLKSDDRQILEGDRPFFVTLRVPANWRGELVEFRAEAEAMTKSFSTSLSSFAGIAPKSHVVGSSRFMVAVHLAGDLEMAIAARRVAEAERAIRDQALRSLRSRASNRSGSPATHVSFRFDISAPDLRMQQERVAMTLDRVIFSKVDPYFDPAIAELSVATRAAILDYLEARDLFKTPVDEKLP